MTGNAEIEDIRHATRQFFATEVLPYATRWREAGTVDRDLWRKAGTLGLLGVCVPQEYGGVGAGFAHAAAVYEEFGRADFVDFGVTIHSGIVIPYFQHLATEAQKVHWLPRLCSGETVAAVAMTEPGAGSDLQAMTTTARMVDGGYSISGSKTFISNGSQADVVVVAARMDRQDGRKGFSLFIVPAETAGFRRGRKLEKIGLRAQDTAELFFDNVHVPHDALLGNEEGQGFRQLMQMLPQERVVIALQGMGAIERALEITRAYVHERKAFGKPLIELQNTRFRLAELATDAKLARVLLDHCIVELEADRLDIATAAMAKWWVTDKQCEIIDACLQLFGGYGYMSEYPISQLYLNARAQRIYGGANEIMKEIIARTL
jgi:acyl-CoA dehydrogenase